MKNLILLFTTVVLLFCVTNVSAQKLKVKIKKDIAYVDDVEYLDMSDCTALNCAIKSLTGEDVLVIQFESFEKPNPVKRNPKSKSPYSSTVTERYSVIKFLGIDLEFESEFTRKTLIRAMFENEVMNEDGTVNEENANKLAKKFGRDISSNKPVHIITN